MQALDVINACAGQLSTAGMGSVTGLNLSAALAVADARGFNSEIMAQLLAEASHGITEGLNENEPDESP